MHENYFLTNQFSLMREQKRHSVFFYFPDVRPNLQESTSSFINQGRNTNLSQSSRRCWTNRQIQLNSSNFYEQTSLHGFLYINDTMLKSKININEQLLKRELKKIIVLNLDSRSCSLFFNKIPRSNHDKLCALCSKNRLSRVLLLNKFVFIFDIFHVLFNVIG